MQLHKTLLYFLIFTIVSSAMAYKLVMASYKTIDYQYEVLTE